MPGTNILASESSLTRQPPRFGNGRKKECYIAPITAFKSYSIIGCCTLVSPRMLPTLRPLLKRKSILLFWRE